MTHHLAELNIARLHQPLDAPESAEFVAALDEINSLAEASPGFVWRLVDESGRSSSYVKVSDDPNVVVNFSVWESVEALRNYVYKTDHRLYLRRRREWFERSDELFMVCYWIPSGMTPDVHDAMRRLERLRADGPSDNGFSLADPLSPPAR